MKRIDLHIHTTASDGTLSPADAVQTASELGLAAVSITDHDTLSGYDEAKRAGEQYGIEVIPGIELSTRFSGPVHILGYFIDTKNDELQKVLDGIVSDRDERNRKICDRMRSDGLNVTYDEMQQRFGNVIGRPHFAQILIEQHLVSSVDEAFENYIGKGKKYWFPRSTLSLEDCIKTIGIAGGISVLAHPFEYDYSSKTLAGLIEHCVDLGLKGIECRHSSHTPGQMAYLQYLADEYGLLKTGGSDFHGSIKPDISIGTGKGLVSVPYSWLQELKNKI